MAKIHILILFIISSLAVLGQKDDVSVNNCEGAINVFKNDDYKIQFTGVKCQHPILEQYKSLELINETNIIWLSFLAPENGSLSFSAETKKDFLQMVIFQEDEQNICTEIKNGVAEIKRLSLDKNISSTGLDFQTRQGFLYPLKLQKNDHIMIAFSTIQESKNEIILNWNFQPTIEVLGESKIVDKRMDDFAATISFKIIDNESNTPIISNLSLEGLKDINGLYVGSEFYYNFDRNVKLSVKCDAEGYFFHDSIYEINAFEDQEIAITLDRLNSGKSMRMQDIEFLPGSSEVTESSLPNLRRLKDFMALNSDINIEIQGHVFALGDNSFAGQRISEARAKRVMMYLIDNGIDRSRLEAVGYGNTRPIFPEPKFFYEEQANRRVEILVK
jgi:outer membrane protein OmpA-like peptidoglycan-associated protein